MSQPSVQRAAGTSGPLADRSVPRTWDELKTATAGGYLNETTWVELKGQLPAPQKPDGNRDLAEDLASLALHGGLYAAGIGEKERNVAGEVVGVELAPNRSRIVSVAANRIDPPLYVEPIEIPDPGRPDHGCLLVLVPATGPHMVDGRYWGRNYDGKQNLTNSEVEAALAHRRVEHDAALRRVRDLETAYLGRVPRDLEQVPRLFLSVIPVGARSECLLPLTSDPSGHPRLQEVVGTLRTDLPSYGRERLPSPLSDTYTWTPHSRGRMTSSQPPIESATQRFQESIALIVDQDGPLDLLQGAISDLTRNQWSAKDSRPFPGINTERMLRTVHDGLALAGRLGADRAAYLGAWQIAVRVHDLTSSFDWVRLRSSHQTPTGYEGDPAYENTVTSTTGELTGQPWVVVERLMARLVRALGVDATFLPYVPTTDAQP